MYTLQFDEKSTCRYCGKSMELLTNKDSGPTKPEFHICFSCLMVFEKGIGEVSREQYT